MRFRIVHCHNNTDPKWLLCAAKLFARIFHAFQSRIDDAISNKFDFWKTCCKLNYSTNLWEAIFTIFSYTLFGFKYFWNRMLWGSSRTFEMVILQRWLGDIPPTWGAAACSSRHSPSLSTDQDILILIKELTFDPWWLNCGPASQHSTNIWYCCTCH